MSLQDLSLPIDIPWKLIATSNDMLASHAKPFPNATWRSSVAIFAYDPDLSDLPETFPDRELTYLKVVCSITSYSPKCFHGRLINHVVRELERATQQTYPCSGALLQVALYPRQGDTPTDVDQLAYITAMEPQKRELIEVVTESGETMTQSRSNLNVRKGVTSTDSNEDLDVLTGVNISGGFGGASASVGVTGQWGTVKRASTENVNTTTTDTARERREQSSHTTNLSQLYHLLNGYHLGTNRAIFFMQPRPHTNSLKDRLTFIDGPQEIEGIQEFFLVVNRPKGKPLSEYCVDALLYTAHLDTEAAGVAILEPKTWETDWSDVLAVVPPKPDPANQFDNWWKWLVPIPGLGNADPLGLAYSSWKAAMNNDETVTDLQAKLGKLPPEFEWNDPAMVRLPYEAPAGWRIDRTRGMGGYDLWEDPDNVTHVPWNREPSSAKPASFIDIQNVGPSSDDLATFRTDAQLTLSAQVYPGKNAPGVYHAKIKIYLVRDDLPNSDRTVDMFVTTRGVSTCADAKFADLYDVTVLEGEPPIVAEVPLSTFNVAPTSMEPASSVSGIDETQIATKEAKTSWGSSAREVNAAAVAAARAKMSNKLVQTMRLGMRSKLACKTMTKTGDMYGFIVSDFAFKKMLKAAISLELPRATANSIGEVAARYIEDHPSRNLLRRPDEWRRRELDRMMRRGAVRPRESVPGPVVNRHELPILFLAAPTLTEADRNMYARAEIHSALDLFEHSAEDLAIRIGVSTTEARQLRLRTLGVQVP